MIDLDFDTKEIKKLLKDFPVDEKVIRASHNAALRKAADYLHKIALRTFSEDLKLSIQLLKNRIKKYRMPAVGGMGRMKLFFGLNSIPMHKLSPQQQSDGVKAGPAFAKSAFMAKLQKGSSRTGVYKRKGKARMPVEAQHYQIDVQAAETAEELADVAALRGWHGVYTQEFERNLIWRSRP